MCTTLIHYNKHTVLTWIVINPDSSSHLNRPRGLATVAGVGHGWCVICNSPCFAVSEIYMALLMQSRHVQRLSTMSMAHPRMLLQLLLFARAKVL